MNNFTRILIIFLVSVILTVIINQFHPVSLSLLLPEGKRPGIPKGEWNELRYIDAHSALEEVLKGNGVIIDVRDKQDFLKSHPAGAINLPYHESEDILTEVFEEVSPDKNLFILCQGTLCGISVRIARQLLDAGFKNVMIVKQNFEVWEKLHLPVEENSDGRVWESWSLGVQELWSRGVKTI